MLTFLRYVSDSVWFSVSVAFWTSSNTALYCLSDCGVTTYNLEESGGKGRGGGGEGRGGEGRGGEGRGGQVRGGEGPMLSCKIDAMASPHSLVVLVNSLSRRVCQNVVLFNDLGRKGNCE